MKSRAAMAQTKTLAQTRRENDAAMNYYAAMSGKGPVFELTPVPTKTAARCPQRGPEADVLSAVLKALALHPAVAWVRRMNTGAIKVGAGLATRFVRFGFIGCSDILGQMRDGRLLAVECKSDKGKLSDEQANFISTVREFGGVAGMARSIDDALLIIKYGQMRGASDTVKAGQGECNSRGFPSGGPHAQPPIKTDVAPDTLCAATARNP